MSLCHHGAVYEHVQVKTFHQYPCLRSTYGVHEENNDKAAFPVLKKQTKKDTTATFLKCMGTVL